jgi:MFS family permease
VTTLGYLGFLVGPPVVGGLAELMGMRAAFGALALVAVALVVATPRLGLEGRVPGTDPGTLPDETA